MQMGREISKESQLGKRKKQNWGTTRKAFKKGKADFQGYYPCAQCGRSYKEIEVDHILGRGSHPDLIHEMTNLQLLCHSCHQLKTDGKI